jgi:hypothetical protein
MKEQIFKMIDCFVLPWRDIDYTKKLDVSDWRDKILNEIHKKKPQTEEQQLYIDEDEEQLVQTESNEKPIKQPKKQKEARTSKNNEDSPKKKFNIYQERR